MVDLMAAAESGGNRPENIAVSAMDKRHSPMRTTAAHVSRTLLDIIRDEEPHALGQKDKRSWRMFRDRLRLRRAGSAWTSSIHIPTSDIPMQTGGRHSNSNSSGIAGGGSQRSPIMTRRNSVRFTTVSAFDATQSDDDLDSQFAGPSSSRLMMTRRTSARFDTGSGSPYIEEHDSVSPGDTRRLRPSMSRHNSTRYPPVETISDLTCDVDEEQEREGSRKLGFVLAEERALSAREAVAAQEAAEAEAARSAVLEGGVVNREETDGERGRPVRMSLMDLLEETDRQMGVEASRYMTGEELAEEGGRPEEEEDNNARLELTCCVCMVRHKGSAFIPCGHTFCRLCSRELWVQRGNCPLCNGFILEILNIF